MYAWGWWGGSGVYKHVVVSVYSLVFKAITYLQFNGYYYDT